MQILVVRRDNIGDLVCTTPFITALRQRFPAAWIGALVNSYNAPVLERNPDLDAVLAYTKLKHLQPGESAAAVLRRRLAMLWRLRRQRLDHVVLVTADARTARLLRWLAPKNLLVAPDPGGGHEVERVFALAALLLAWLWSLARRRPSPPEGDTRWLLWGAALAAWFITVMVGVVNTTLHHEHGILAMLLLGAWLSSPQARAS